jgi:hypothetical protein
MARKITRFRLAQQDSFALRGAVDTPRPANLEKVRRSWHAKLGLLTAPHIFYSLTLSFLFLTSLFAQETLDTNLWRAVPSYSLNSFPSTANIQPDAFLAFNLDHSRLQPLLNNAPKELNQSAIPSTALITLPMPDGKLQRFRFVESPVMAPELAAQFPEIKTYVGQGIDDSTATVRFDSIPSGFHAQILSPNGAVYIDPYFHGNTNLYACYYKRDYRRAAGDFTCFAADESITVKKSGAKPLAVGDNSLRTYRLACAATGEYTQFFGGTVAGGLAAIVSAINRVTGIYESETGIRLVLVAKNNLIVYTNPNTDPYTGNNPSLLLTQNQSNLDYIIGNTNYDIGHVFSTAGGGMAGVGVTCVPGSKAYGETGIYPPTGDAFWIDYVAHEMGHQFGASHTFNGGASGCAGNRCASTAFEPGSGSTIMAYAGVCGSDNLQPHSDPYFHSASLEQIKSFITCAAGSACTSVTALTNNSPVIDAGANFTIPKGTPFALSATGSDPDGDPPTWCWEERDLGPCIALTAPDNGTSPLFRSFNPTTNSSRIFLRLTDIINNTVTPGESLPTTNRTMHFRVTARDNHLGGGGVSSADMQVTVFANAGPFRITAPNSPITWSGYQTITWDVAGTTSPPINAAKVNILLSTNGGLSFSILLAANVPNSGIQDIILPSITTSTARFKIQASDNIFFDISRANFSIANGKSLIQPPPPAIRSLRVTNGLAAITWSAIPGGTYRLQYKDTLECPIWHDLGDFPATTTIISTTDLAGVAAQRFYRVLLLQ